MSFVQVLSVTSLTLKFTVMLVAFVCNLAPKAIKAQVLADVGLIKVSAFFQLLSQYVIFNFPLANNIRRTL